MLVSVIVCSIDDAKLAAVTTNYRERLVGVAHEIVTIRDALTRRGLQPRRADCEGRSPRLFPRRRGAPAGRLRTGAGGQSRALRHRGRGRDDADFAFNAAKRGLRVGVDNGFLLLHHSPGRFDDRWLHYRERFLAKHFPGRMLPPPQRPRLMVFPFASRDDLAAQWNIEQARALTARMHALAAGRAAG